MGIRDVIPLALVCNPWAQVLDHLRSEFLKVQPLVEVEVRRVMPGICTTRPRPLAYHHNPTPWTHWALSIDASGKLNSSGAMAWCKSSVRASRRRSACSPASADARTLGFGELESYLSTPGTVRHLELLSPPLRSTTFFSSRCNPRRLTFPIFPNPNDLKIERASAHIPKTTIPDVWFTPFQGCEGDCHFVTLVGSRLGRASPPHTMAYSSVTWTRAGAIAVNLPFWRHVRRPYNSTREWFS